MRVSSIAVTALGLVPSALGADLFVSHFSGTVYTLSYTAGNNGNGSLAVKSSASGCGKMPSWLTYDAPAKSLYCFDETGSWGGGSVVASFAVNADGSVKSSGQAKSTGGEVHGSLYGGVNGTSFVAMAEYDPSTVTTYKLPLTSSSQVLQKEKFTMSQPGPVASRQNAPHPHAIFKDPTGLNLLAPDLGADLIRIFSVDTSSGKLTACPAAQAGAGDGPRHGAWWAPTAGTTKGQMLYTINELSNTVSAWTVKYSTNGCLSLTKTQTLSVFAPGKTPAAQKQPTKAAEVRVAGNFLYASVRNDQTFGSQQDSLATYSIDATTGALTFVESTKANAWYPRTFSINKAGTLVAVGGQTSANVAIVARDPTTGKLGSLLASLPVGSKGTDGGEDGLSSVIWAE